MAFEMLPTFEVSFGRVEKLARTQFNHYQNFADCVTLQIASLCLMQPISHAANLTFSGPKGY